MLVFLSQPILVLTREFFALFNGSLFVLRSDAGKEVADDYFRSRFQE